MNRIEVVYEKPTVRLDLSVEDASTLYSAIDFYRNNQTGNAHSHGSMSRLVDLFRGCQEFHNTRSRGKNGRS